MTGLRELKKQQTRNRIADVAIRLFAERGFDNVAVAAIAREAEVSEATVFNYFPSKEDLVYGGMDEFEEALVEAVRERKEGQSAFGAFREFLLQPRGALTSGQTDRIATAARIIAGSPALQARELRSFDRHTAALAEVLQREGQAAPWVVANALIGVQRAMKDAVHRHALAGRHGDHITKDVIEQARVALDVLERGL
ncbi:TetR family transcriptional regulator [Lentzea sp. NBRC 105346]|uniref:TetR/AcrR family transcriptional regulator n=1 Tax=Lentzea sp. NBRC 105346 TaxID=3032205 RepID=UPI0024A602D2|nr:TetR family transcriptional regulator [Lentzea sp. NBRC 105346]GLZ28462.1 TetR family transcriptional regulator [Lentzea sp. NBRC 105346]